MDYLVVYAFCLLAVGLALIVAELFIPSGGFISVLSMLCLVASIYCAHDAWWDKNPGNFWWFLGSIVGLIPITAGTTLYLLSRTRFGNRVFLEAPKLEDVTPYVQETEERKQLIGKPGKTQTLMAPGGLVIVEGKRFHAETEGQMLDADQPIQIIAVKGNRVVVRPYEPVEETSEPSTLARKPPKDEPPIEPKSDHLPVARTDLAESASESGKVPLDFEIPDS